MTNRMKRRGIERWSQILPYSHPRRLFWVTLLGEGAIEGIIVARSKGYLDVSVKALDALEIRRDKTYRLDTVINRVSYDRMINSLQLFLQVEEGMPAQQDPLGISFCTAIQTLSLASQLHQVGYVCLFL